MMSKNMKILICGYGEHGKDEVAKKLKEQTGLTFISSSEFIGEKVVYPLLKDKEGYKTFKDYHSDRRNHRVVWFNAICDYNSVEPDKLTVDLLKEYDIYVGMRNPLEFKGSQHHFDLKVWVDASKRVKKESEESNGFGPEDFDYIIDNNGDLNDLEKEVERLAVYIELWEPKKH